MKRFDEREKNELRAVTIEKDYLIHPEGSVLISAGSTKVICNASVEEKVPPFMRGEGKGWISAEYAMLPRATGTRNIRESSKGKVSGRTMEIQRLIGRALRAVVDLDALGERTIWLDCDVIQADGGTRTASITGAFVAMSLAIYRLHLEKPFDSFPIKDYLAAISVGILEDETAVLDLNYVEDSAANVDMNLIMTGAGQFVELQGTGEEATFSEEELVELLSLGKAGIKQLVELQKTELGEEITNLIEGE
ncbi:MULTISPECIES: ribonuclease PH [Listeria]|uniref:Ribonuclease PH n=1 Tax=Listeria kieliensis TaxID=1621700 RepID=A0A3D8TWQ6_9LIST|nr:MULTISPECIES: ribonuclease PH [Listeria]RDX02574.1 ribonuclease PH [Listeria kieliensis]